MEREGRSEKEARHRNETWKMRGATMETKNKYEEYEDSRAAGGTPGGGGEVRGRGFRSSNLPDFYVLSTVEDLQITRWHKSRRDIPDYRVGKKEICSGSSRPRVKEGDEANTTERIPNWCATRGKVITALKGYGAFTRKAIHNAKEALYFINIWYSLYSSLMCADMHCEKLRILEIAVLVGKGIKCHKMYS
ncbi:hypothetical protein KM043_013647 [Ampulex compressa]|nr:hypothetical protein KM043_013647 [Ampulex compressa]